MLRLTKSEILKAVYEAAEKQRRPGENEHVARARFWQTPEGQRARIRLDAASGEMFADREDVRKSEAESPITPAYAKLREIGDEIRSDRPELSRAESNVEAMNRRPDLLRRYYEERQEYRRKMLAT